MLLAFKIGCLNVFRNKRRSILAALGISIGITSLIITDAFINGMEENMIKSGTSSFVGEAQVHNKGFQKSYEIEKVIGSKDSLVSILEKNKDVLAFTERVITGGMISSASNVKNVMIFGVEKNERKISKVFEGIIKGVDLFSHSLKKGMPIIIGEKLSKLLEVTVGDKVVVTSTQFKTGDLSQELFRIVGIFKMNITELDKRMIFVPLKDAQKILGLGKNIHEIAIKFHSISTSGKLDLPLWNKLSKDMNKAMGWKELMPGLNAAISMGQYSTAIIGLILMIIVGVGIINVMFMAIYERFFEFGVLKAVGTRPFDIVIMIISEAFSISVLSVIFGILLTGCIGIYTSTSGFDYSGIEYAEITFLEPIYTIFNIRQFILYPIFTIIFTTLISIYPAIFAAKLTPSQAMKKTF